MACLTSTKIPTLNLNPSLTHPKPEEFQCRICFETLSIPKDLINPCKCTGSMRYVHEECLKLWILSSRQDIKEATCDICKHPFTMEIKLARKCSCEVKTDECFNLFIFPIVILIISAILTIVLAYLIQGVNQGTINTEEKVYFSLVLLTCTCILSALILAFVKTLSRAFCLMKMATWRIKSLVDCKLDETYENTNQTEAIITELVIEPVQIMQPKLAWYRVRSIIVPEISQVTVARVIQDRANYFSSQVSQRSDNNVESGSNQGPLTSLRKRRISDSINL